MKITQHSPCFPGEARIDHLAGIFALDLHYQHLRRSAKRQLAIRCRPARRPRPVPPAGRQVT
jgi:hypothetical protein